MNRSITHVFLIMIAIMWLALPFARTGSTSTDDHDPSDAFDPKIAALTDMDQMQAVLPQYTIDTGHAKRDTAQAITKVVSLHFVHGVARQTWRENWIANVMDMIGFENRSFSGVMRPDDILKHPVAFCSQVSLVMQAMFERNGIPYGTSSFNHGGRSPHSAIVGDPDGVWRFYDASMEPTVQGMPFDELVAGRAFLDLYSASVWTNQGVDRKFYNLAQQGRIRLTGINGDRASRGIAFQRFTAWLSNWGWIIPLLASLSFVITGWLKRANNIA